MKETEESQHEKTPSWLKTIQLNSWEAELLISALVLYALFQIPDFLGRTSLQIFERGSSMHALISMLKDAFQLLSIGYILHILVRGIWVASVGLSYVYPKGVDHKALKFKGNFKKELKSNGSLVNMVLRLEKFSSIIYGISFVFFGTLIGFGAFIFSFTFSYELVTPALNDSFYLTGAVGLLMLLYFFLTILVFFDFLSNGLLRRKNWSADWFYYVARIFRIVTLSFLYRRSLLVLISNTKGWKSYLIPFIILFVTVGFMQLKKMRQNNVINSYHINGAKGDYSNSNYENVRNANDYLITTIQSDIVHDNTLKLFLKDIGSFDRVYKFEVKGRENGEWDQLPSDSVSKYFDKRLNVSIDGEKIGGLKWFKNQHATTLDFGFTTFIDLNPFEQGAHFLKIGIDTVGMKKSAKRIVDKEKYSLQTIANIYFIYDSK